MQSRLAPRLLSETDQDESHKNDGTISVDEYAPEDCFALSMLREAMGDAVIDHYVRAAEWEQEDFDRKVTDYERARGFEAGNPGSIRQILRLPP